MLQPANKYDNGKDVLCLSNWYKRQTSFPNMATMTFTYWSRLLISLCIAVIFIDGFWYKHNLQSRGKTNIGDQNVNISQLLANYRWLNRTNVIPNYYTVGTRNQFLQRGHPIVFVHNHKSAGKTMKHCLRDLFVLTNSLSSNRNTLMVFNDFEDIYRKLASSNIPENVIFRGGYTFGVCSLLTRPCSYFTVLREPYERTVSHYIYCMNNTIDHICKPHGSYNKTINEWALRVGSHFTEQLFNNVDLCSGKYKNKSQKRTSKCWLKLQRYFKDMLTEKEKDAFLGYPLDNIHKWFTVIGLSSEIDVTFDLLEKAYGLPFSVCKESNWTVTQTNIIKRHDKSQRYDLMKKLLDDPEVEKVLHYDVKLYMRAVDIFKEEKTMLESNKTS